MSKQNCFLVVRLALCCLFFAAPVGVFGMKKIDVPDNIANDSGKDFYVEVEHDKTENLWFCMELITQNNVDWWKKRLAHEIYMHVIVPEILIDWLKDRNDQKRRYWESLPEYDRSYEPEQLTYPDFRIGSLSRVPTKMDLDDEFLKFNYSSFFDFFRMGHTYPFNVLFEKICNYYYGGASDNDANALDIMKRMPFCSVRCGLTNALKAFSYSLNHYTDGGQATWVAYVSSRPVNGPLCLEKGFDIASPDIKMAVTVIISDPFYTNYRNI